MCHDSFGCVPQTLVSPNAMAEQKTVARKENEALQLAARLEQDDRQDTSKGVLGDGWEFPSTRDQVRERERERERETERERKGERERETERERERARLEQEDRQDTSKAITEHIFHTCAMTHSHI